MRVRDDADDTTVVVVDQAAWCNEANWVTPAQPACGASYLERSANSVLTPQGSKPQGQFLGTRTEIKRVGCRCRFCPKCCKRAGDNVRRRLIPALQGFRNVLMLALTVDPKLFASPEATYDYVRNRRAVAKLVDKLYSLGVLYSKRYFVALEFQKETQMPHWHVLVDADFIEHKTLAREWGRYRPKPAGKWEGSYAGSLKGQAPEFGSVRISKRRDLDPIRAANYACKYLTKYPQNGWPDWVLDRPGQMKLHASSRGLMPDPKRKPPEPGELTPKLHKSEAEKHPDICFCAVCRGEEKPSVAPSPKPKSVRERMRECGVKAMLIHTDEYEVRGGEIESGRPRFVKMMDFPFQEIAERLRGADFEGDRIELSPWELRVFGDEAELVRTRLNRVSKRRGIMCELWTSRAA